MLPLAGTDDRITSSSGWDDDLKTLQASLASITSSIHEQKGTLTVFKQGHCPPSSRRYLQEHYRSVGASMADQPMTREELIEVIKKQTAQCELYRNDLKCLHALYGKSRREYASLDKWCDAVEATSRDTIERLETANAHLRQDLAASRSYSNSREQQHQRQVASLQEKLKAAQTQNQMLDSHNLRLLSDTRSLRGQVEAQDFKLGKFEKVVTEQQAQIAAHKAPVLPPFAPRGVTPKPWTVPGQQTKLNQLTADNAKLLQEVTQLQQHNDELQQQSQLVQEALDEVAETKFELSAMSSSVRHLEKQKQQWEAEQQQAQASNQQLQGLVAQLQNQLLELQHQGSSMAQQQQRTGTVSDEVVAAAQAALKPVAVTGRSSSSSRISSSTESQPDEPGTPEVTDTSCSCSSSRRTSDVCAAYSSHGCSNSGSATGDDDINSLHPLYGCLFWVY